MEHRKRSIAKALSWRTIATITTMVIVYIYTRELVLSFGVGIVEVSTKMLFYYLHERTWMRISWGKSSPEEDQFFQQQPEFGD